MNSRVEAFFHRSIPNIFLNFTIICCKGFLFNQFQVYWKTFSISGKNKMIRWKGKKKKTLASRGQHYTYLKKTVRGKNPSTRSWRSFPLTCAYKLQKIIIFLPYNIWCGVNICLGFVFMCEQQQLGAADSQRWHGINKNVMTCSEGRIIFLFFFISVAIGSHRDFENVRANKHTHHTNIKAHTTPVCQAVWAAN